MKLSTKGRYAVMAMVDLARYGNDRPVCLSDIAERQEISLSYLEQLFAKLRRGGLVKSVRGPGGGYLLTHHRDDTRIADIILAVDEPCLGLAEAVAKRVYDVLAQIHAAGTTLIVVEEAPRRALTLCNKRVEVRNGMAVAV